MIGGDPLVSDNEDIEPLFIVLGKFGSHRIRSWKALHDPKFID